MSLTTHIAEAIEWSGPGIHLTELCTIPTTERSTQVKST